MRQEFTGTRGLHDSLFQRVKNVKRDTNILDLGCGTGAWLDRLACSGFTRLTGVDKDVSVAAGIKARLVEADLDFSSLRLEHGPFALITAIEVLEHVQNPGSFIKFVAMHLAAGGEAIITTPNIQSLPCRLGFLVKGRLPNFDEKAEPSHIYPVLLVAFEKLLREHGLEIRERWGYPGRGSQLYRLPTNVLAGVLRMVCRDDVPGDVLCLSIVQQTA